MKPVKQKIKDNINGDCFRASAASILEIELEQAPDVARVKDWVPPTIKKYDEAGFKLVELKETPKDKYVIGVYGHNSGKISHAVVMKNGYIIHNPDGTDINEIMKNWKLYYLFTIEKK